MSNGRKSKNKGARGERELASKLSELFGIEAHRGRQYAGGPGTPDVITDIDGIHFEVKRCESLSLYKAMDQSEFDAKEKLPTVAHRRNHKDWLFICYLYDLPEIVSILSEYVEKKEERNLGESIRVFLDNKRKEKDSDTETIK